MAPHSSTLAWKIPWTEEPGRLQSMGSLRVAHDWATSLSLSLSCIGEGNGKLLQCSCLENPRGREAWWAAVYGVAQSRTRLKRLSSSSSSMTMAKSLKPDFSYHLTFFRKVSRDLNVTHWEPSSHHVQCITHPISEKVLYKTSSTILTIELKYCEFLICPDDNFTF